MAVTQRVYPYTPEFLLNAIYDIREMRKAKAIKLPVKNPDVAEVEMITDMYTVKQTYLFRLTRGKAGTVVEIESNDSTENAAHSVGFMLSVLDAMIEPFRGKGYKENPKTGTR